MNAFITAACCCIVWVYPTMANGQECIAPHNMMALCQGLGQAAATVASGREQGVPDEENEGVQVLARLSRHSGNDFLGHISQFLGHADKLPATWQGMLYTHACWHSYQDNSAQVSLMASLLPYRCDLEQPVMACIDKTFLTLPGPAEAI